MIILTLLHFAEDEKKAEKEELVEVSLEELQKQEENPKIKGKNEAKGNNKYYFWGLILFKKRSESLDLKEIKKIGKF